MTAPVSSASVIDLRAYVDPSVVPTLVLVDLQQEYICAPRVLALPHAAEALANCRIALAHARAKGFPVAFGLLGNRHRCVPPGASDHLSG